MDWGTVGGRKREWGGESQFTSNLGPGWTRIAPHRKEGFQVNERDPGTRYMRLISWTLWSGSEQLQRISR